MWHNDGSTYFKDQMECCQWKKDDKFPKYSQK